MITIGIDPGNRGAIAVLDDGDLRVYAMPTSSIGGKERTDVAALTDLIGGFGAVRLALIELVGPQGKLTTVQTGYSLGWSLCAAYSACVLSGVPVDLRPPARWKRDIGIPVTDNAKAAAVGVADSLFPTYRQMFRGPRGGVLDGHAEAALMAELAARIATGRKAA